MRKKEKNPIKSLWLVLVFVFVGLSGFSQIDNNRYKVTLNPQDLSTCGGSNNSDEVVEIVGKNASCHDFEITFDLPTGIDYVSGTVSIVSQSGSGDFTVTEVNITDLNHPVFGVKRPGDANW